MGIPTKGSSTPGLVVHCACGAGAFIPGIAASATASLGASVSMGGVGSLAIGIPANGSSDSAPDGTGAMVGTPVIFPKPSSKSAAGTAGCGSKDGKG